MNTLRLIKQRAVRVEALTADSSWLDACLPDLKDSKLVLLGEASHGTHEFYRMRAEITKRLIAEAGFNAVAVEADWPDAYRVNRYVKGAGKDSDGEAALSGFKRFPAWMWRNADILDFVGWLRAHNDSLAPERPKAGFYGLDLYSLFSSMDIVIRYLEKKDPQAAARARRRYACFDHFGKNAQAYARSTGLRISQSCEGEVVAQLRDIQQRGPDYSRSHGVHAEDDSFSIEQNARVVQNAERYYRTMLHGNVASWNLRDEHMVETLNLLLRHLGRRVEAPKLVIWAHNSHLGDARATEMGADGEWNVGELVRERFQDRAFLLGFTTYAGTVTAAADWDGAAERMSVRPAQSGSYEELFHRADLPRFVLNFRKDEILKHALKAPLLERAIGVIYRPKTERTSHYFQARLSDQFDAIFHLDRTRAVEPLEKTAEWAAGEVPETYPSAV
ncbi:MAG: erythromycin esterase family protein [Elusimicrobia bacterium]|nr:erythromycin esterase family protein [Elusimicrobiota bacterium]